jgi:DNA-binding CsgD family transcriptional regulator
MFERDRELSAIGAWATPPPSGAILVIEGPPGIGKTTLLTAARAAARDAGFQVLSALGGELEREFPFGLVRQLFELRLRTIAPHERARVFSGAARHAAPIVRLGSTAELPPVVDPSETALHGLYWLAANLAAERPLALTIDDAQWGDAASLRWLAYLGRRLGGLPIALAVGTRPQAHPACAQMLTAVTPLARVLRPQPLSVAATASVIAETLGHPADQFAATCRAVTGGNPLLVRQLADALAADGVPPDASAAAKVAEAGPVAVSRIVAMRLAGLPAAALPLLRAVAVGGTSVPLDQAAAVAQIDLDEAARLADRLTALDLLRPGRPLALVHPIVRTVVLAETPPADLELLHVRSARHLDAHGASAAEVATQLLATEPRNDQWVTETLRGAARSAVAAGAPQAAVAFLRRARAEPPVPERRGDVLLELGRAAAAAREGDAVDSLSEALETAPDERARAVVAIELGRVLMLSARLGEAVAVLDAERARIEPVDHHRAMRLELELLGAGRVDLDLRSRFAARFERLRRHADAPGPLQRAILANLAFEAGLAGDPVDHVADLAERALGGGALLREESALSPVYYLAANALLFADRLGAAHAALTDAIADAQERGSVLGFAIASCFRSHANHCLGRLVDAEADALASLETASEHGWELGRPASLAFLIEARLDGAGVSEAEREAAAAEPPPNVHGNLLLYSRARLRSADGDLRGSLDDLLDCGRRQQRWLAPNPAVVHWRAAAALVAARLGDAERGRALAHEELRLSRATGAAPAVGHALRAAALVEGGDDGLRLLHESVAVLNRSPAALELAKSLVHLGGAVRRAGRREEARGHLRRGLALAQSLGARRLEREALDELRTAGARRRSRTLTGVDALTASERRTAEMAASGMTNREIAQALFVTIKTVEGHLRAAFMKLGIRSRAELPALLGHGPRTEKSRVAPW